MSLYSAICLKKFNQNAHNLRFSLSQSINHGGVYTGGALPCLPYGTTPGLRLACLHAGSLPILSDSQQEASTWHSQEFCGHLYAHTIIQDKSFSKHTLVFILFITINFVLPGAPGRPLPEPPQSDGSGPDTSLSHTPDHNNAT